MLLESSKRVLECMPSLMAVVVIGKENTSIRLEEIHDTFRGVE